MYNPHEVINLGINRQTKDTVMSLRLFPHEEERYNTLAYQAALSKPKFLVKLMDVYESCKDFFSDSSGEDRQISLQTVRISGDRFVPAKTFYITGRLLYAPDALHDVFLFQHPQYVEMLEKDFQLYVDEPQYYNFYRGLSLYWDSPTGRFLVREHLRVLLIEDHNPFSPMPHLGDRPLEIIRYKFVANYNDVITNFSRYAHHKDLERISEHIAEDIGTDYDKLEEYF